ncbi:MAG: Holliday junction branch migration protein RuvA [Clostridia bacterium]|jgi:Holliday junction DNA helicase RuvA|nr:Holliday junction branch migration protein RuvA [Clostridia bacterium]
MYYYINGTLAAKGENYLVVDNSGVGYMIYTSLSCIEKAGSVGSEITVYTYLNVREDAMELYGFYSEEERKMFLLLISVSGVGPKAGLALLSVASPQKLASAIITGDEKLLTKASGVGPKAAKRVILELKDKIDNEALGLSAEIDDAPAREAVIIGSKAEAMSALTVLGYNAQEAKTVLAKLDESLSTEELIKKALVQLM